MRRTNRVFRLGAAIFLLSGIVTTATSSFRGVANAASAPLCSALKLSGQATTSSRPGGTTVRVALTNHSFPKCTWSNLTGFQFLSADGAGAGPVWRASNSARGVIAKSLYDTFQVIDNVVTKSGVHCAYKVASFVQVITPDKTNVKIAIGRRIGVCVGGITKWSLVDPAMFPAPIKCAPMSIKVTLGPADGAAGTTYLPLRFTNIGSSACSIGGVPVVQPMTGANVRSVHRAVGPIARTVDLSANGNGDPIRLEPGDIASAPLGVVDTGNFTPSQCRATVVQSLRLRIANGPSWWIRASFSVCTGLASTTISGVVPAKDGVAPLS